MNSLNIFLNKVQLALLLLTGFAFPLLILPQLTDPFLLPKQGLILGIVLLLLVISGINLLTGGEIKLRRTPFDLPILGLSLVLVISTALSVAPLDSLIFTVTFLSLVLLYYLLVNLLREEFITTLFTLSLLVGAALASLISILSFSKIYFLPAFQAQNFSPLGGLVPAAIFFLLLTPLGLGLASNALKKDKMLISGITLVSTLLIVFGFLLATYQLFTTQKPLFLPQEVGLATATASIGQNFQTLLFGSGPSTYLIDFTRFKNPNFNNFPFWNTLFFSSSSLFLELLATTGLLGIGFFLLLFLSVIRTFKNRVGKMHVGLAISLLILALASFILPLSFTTLFLLFVLLGLYTTILGEASPRLVYDTKIWAVNLQEGLGVATNIFSLILVAAILLTTLAAAFFGGKFLISDILFQRSLVAAGENRGPDTYFLQNQAINTFRYRDSFARLFSQTNLALATNISQDIRQRNASPSAQEQQTILTLVDQSIKSAQEAKNLSPQNFLNWDNLAGIYRNLIGFGQNAEGFAATSLQQAINLNPTNPNLYLALGGIYFQLGQWEGAQRQFEIAVRLKPDLANAYYNLGHALENRGDLAGALVQYQTVEAFLARDEKDSDNHKKIQEEIKALEARIGREGKTVAAVPPPQPALRQAQGGQEKLQVSTPSATLPSQEKKVELPPPTEATESAK